MTDGDHASIIDFVPEYSRHSPEGYFGHYLIMVGALGGAACTAKGTQFGQYESVSGTGQPTYGRPVNRPRRALVLAHEPQGTSALVGERLQQRGYDVHEHVVTSDLDRPNDAAPFPDLADYNMLVPMGSIRSLTNTDEIDSWIFDEISMVQAARQRGTPMLGVCFGGQLLAAALGGTVEQAPVPEIGWYDIHGPDESPNGHSNPLGPGPWFQWHHDRFTPPPEADVLAVNANSVQLFRLGRCVGAQFHPEVTYAHLEGLPVRGGRGVPGRARSQPHGTAG